MLSTALSAAGSSLLSLTAASPLLSLPTELTPALCTHHACMHGCFQTPPVHAGFPLQLMFARSPSLQLCLYRKRMQPHGTLLGDSSALHTEELQICMAVKPRARLRLIATPGDYLLANLWGQIPSRLSQSQGREGGQAPIPATSPEPNRPRAAAHQVFVLQSPNSSRR